MGARVNRRYCRQRVPMIRCGDDHDLRLLLTEHFAKVIVLTRLIAVEVSNLLRAHLARLFVHIANAHHLALAVRDGVAQNIHAPPAGANDGRAIFFAGRRQ